MQRQLPTDSRAPHARVSMHLRVCGCADCLGLRLGGGSIFKLRRIRGRESPRAGIGG